MWYTTQQRLLFAAVGAVAGGAAVLDTRRFVLHQTDGTADQWVSPPPPAQPLPVRATSHAPRCVAPRSVPHKLPHAPRSPHTHTQAPPPFLSHSHRAHLVRSWNDGACVCASVVGPLLVASRLPYWLPRPRCGRRVQLAHPGVLQTGVVKPPAALKGTHTRHAALGGQRLPLLLGGLPCCWPPRTHPV